MSVSEANSDSRTYRARPSDESMRELAEAIARLNADGDYIARALTESLLAQRPTVDEGLTPQEADYLVRSGAFTSEEFRDASVAVAHGDLPAGAVSTLLASLHQTMSVENAAGFLNLDEEALERAVEAGELYAVDVAGRRRFPSWQFSLSSPGKLLPHLVEIIALVKGTNWISVSGLMATPQTTMVTHGRQTPVEWFRGGGGIGALEKTIEGQRWR